MLLHTLDAFQIVSSRLRGIAPSGCAYLFNFWAFWYSFQELQAFIYKSFSSTQPQDIDFVVIYLQTTIAQDIGRVKIIFKKYFQTVKSSGTLPTAGSPCSDTPFLACHCRALTPEMHKRDMFFISRLTLYLYLNLNLKLNLWQQNVIKMLPKCYTKVFCITKC